MRRSIFIPDLGRHDLIPLINSTIWFGLPAPGYQLFERLNINDYLKQRPNSTFFMKAKGNNMMSKIYNGDLLIIDKSLDPVHDSVVIAIIDGQFAVRRILIEKKRVYLAHDNLSNKKIDITMKMESYIWGVVTYAIHRL
jgi:DNA polymerase V